MGKHLESWVNLNQYFRNPHHSHELNLSHFLENRLSYEWVDSCLRDTVWILSWFESRHLSRMPKKCHRKSTFECKAQKSSTKLSESPKKVNDISSWFESLIHELIRINIPDSYLSHESIWIKILESFLGLELIWIKKFWNLFFESWVDLNQISEIHFQSWAVLNQFL